MTHFNSPSLCPRLPHNYGLLSRVERALRQTLTSRHGNGRDCEGDRELEYMLESFSLLPLLADLSVAAHVVLLIRMV